MPPSSGSEDPVLDDILHRAAADEEVVGLVLSGSRGAGCATAESDYDIEWVLTDAAYARKKEREEPLTVHKQRAAGGALLDISYTCLQEMGRLAEGFTGWTPGYATAQILLDKTGEVAGAVQAIIHVPEGQRQGQVAFWFDSYLNAFYRSLKAWRRGDELGGRLQAVESAMHLIRTLFILDGRWPPYPDRLLGQFDSLHGQGWPAGRLEGALLEIARTGEPAHQQELEAQAEALLRRRGFGHILEAWGGEIERVKAFRFD